MNNLVPLEIAQAEVFKLCSRLDAKKLKLSNALGAVCAEDILAKEQVPPFDNTAMDGFALKAADTSRADEKNPVSLKITGTLKAGSSLPELKMQKMQNGSAVRIMTGAPIPPGADAVIEIEKTAVQNTDGTDGEEHLILSQPVQSGAHIRKAGGDVMPNQLILGQKSLLTPAALGMLASQGIYEIMAYPKCRVGVASTGSELIEGNIPLKPGQIRDSNRHLLLALIEKAGMEAVDLGIIKDTENAINKLFARAGKKCDALITSGGVSMGDFDYVKKVLAQNSLGNSLGNGNRNGAGNSAAASKKSKNRGRDLENRGYAIEVAIKPAKPLAFGLVNGLMVFGLPGNPVSSAISFELFARPGLRKMMGYENLHSQRVRATAGEDFERTADGKTHFVRVQWKYQNGSYEFKSAGAQGSHQLKGLADANGLAIIEDGPGLKAGQQADLICLD